MVAAASIIISPAPSTPRTRKEHWLNDAGTKFHNPWASFYQPGAWTMVKAVSSLNSKETPEEVDEQRRNLPTVKPTWGSAADAGKMKATWLGHAAYLVEMPARSGEDRGVRVLFDPAFSYRASPSQSFGGAARIQPLACEVEDLPEVDVIVISHNHYDHQDNNTLTALYQKQAKYPPALFIPLNNIRGLPSAVPKDKVIELDWWEDRTVEVEGKGKIKLTCTPCQHFSSRYGYDRNWSLWGSWALNHVPSKEGEDAPSVWFGGDTGYCHREAPEDAHRPPLPDVPVCPAFAEVGEKLGPFTLGLIPIGAYLPKIAFAPIHADPFEALRIFKDIRCKTAVGIHYGVWRMAIDKLDEPLGLLAEARKQMGVTEEEFGTCKVGETRAYDA